MDNRVGHLCTCVGGNLEGVILKSGVGLREKKVFNRRENFGRGNKTKGGEKRGGLNGHKGGVAQNKRPWGLKGGVVGGLITPGG